MSTFGLTLLVSLFLSTSAPEHGLEQNVAERAEAARARVASALADYSRAGGEEDATALVQDLRELQAELLPALFAHLAEQPLTGTRGGLPELRGVYAVARDLGRPTVVQFLTGLVETESLGAAGRAAALALLDPVAQAEDLGLALELYADPSEAGAAGARRRQLHELALRVVRDDPDAVKLIPLQASSHEGPARSLLVRAIGAEANESGWEALVSLLGSDAALDRATLASVAELARRWPGTAPAGLGEQIATYYDDEDRTLARYALEAVAALDDQSSLPRLIDLLLDAEPTVAATAHEALRALTGLGLPADAARWRQWMESEERWWRTEAPALLADLSGGALSDSRSALRVLSRHRLRRDEIAAELLRTLERGAPILRPDICEALGHLGAKNAAPALVELVRTTDPDSSLHASAADALSRLGIPLERFVDTPRPLAVQR